MLFLKPPFQNKLHLKISTFLVIKIFKFQTVQIAETFHLTGAGSKIVIRLTNIQLGWIGVRLINYSFRLESSEHQWSWIQSGRSKKYSPKVAGRYFWCIYRNSQRFIDMLQSRNSQKASLKNRKAGSLTGFGQNNIKYNLLPNIQISFMTLTLKTSVKNVMQRHIQVVGFKYFPFKLTHMG